MAITVTEINTELESRLGVTIGAASLYPEVNRALNVISKLARWPDLRTTDTLSFTATDKYVAFAKEVFQIDDVVIDGYAPLELADYKDIKRAQERTNAQTGRPLFYAMRSKRLYAHPIADGAYSVVVELWQLHPKLADEDGTILSSEDFREAIVTQTIVQYLKGSGKTKHPKLKENFDLFGVEMQLLMDYADEEDVTVTEPFQYGIS